jgi:aspartate/methionine/tyrosine aminotransferase
MKKAWEDNYTLLYSFSKVFHLTGHRVGAVVTSKTRLIEMEKFLDSSTICPSQLGQLAALYGLNKLSNWVSNQRNKVNLKRNELIKCFRPLQTKGWKLSGLGAYFAYLEHPFDVDSKILSKLILEKLSILVVPGALFYEKDNTNGDKFIRIAFANISVKEIKILFKRLESFQP